MEYLIAGMVLSALLVLVLLLEINRNRRTRFKTITVRGLPAGPGEATCFKTLHISDIHLSAKSLDRLLIFERLAGIEWDFVFITGDLIDDDSGITPVCRALGRLRARYGRYAVLGNHDFVHINAENPVQWFSVIYRAIRQRALYTADSNDIERLRHELAGNGVELMRNELREGRTCEGMRFQIFGIDDPASGLDRPEALHDSVDSEALRLVLIHSPQRLAGLGPLAPHLVLCGHTHGGQIRLPLWGAFTTHSEAHRRAASGLVELGGHRVHISPGIGAGKVLPIRVLSPPEVTRLDLCTGPADNVSPGGESRPDAVETLEMGDEIG